MTTWLIGMTAFTAWITHIALSHGRDRLKLHEALLTSFVALTACALLFYPVLWLPFIPLFLIQIVLFISIKRFVDQVYCKPTRQDMLRLGAVIGRALALTIALHVLFLIVVLRLPGEALAWQLSAFVFVASLYAVMHITRMHINFKLLIMLIFFSSFLFITNRLATLDSYTVDSDTGLFTRSMKPALLGTSEAFIAQNREFHQGTVKDGILYGVTDAYITLLRDSELTLTAYDFSTEERFVLYERTAFVGAVSAYIDLVSHGEHMYMLSQSGLYKIEGTKLVPLMTVDLTTGGTEFVDFYHALYHEKGTLYYHDETTRYKVEGVSLIPDDSPFERYGGAAPFLYHFSYHGTRYDQHKLPETGYPYVLYGPEGPVRADGRSLIIESLQFGQGWYRLFRNQRLTTAQVGDIDVAIKHPEAWSGRVCFQAQTQSCLAIDTPFYHLSHHDRQLYLLTSDHFAWDRGPVDMKVATLTFDRLTFNTVMLNDLQLVYLLGLVCLFIPMRKRLTP